MKSVIAALAANLAIAIAKFAAFLITGSASMLAEAVHSVADTGNEVLLLIGGGKSRRARTAEHPFATLKAWMGATHFLTKTLPKVRTEMSLHVLAYNMKRAINLLGTRALLQAITA